MLTISLIIPQTPIIRIFRIKTKTDYERVYTNLQQS
jgi:hypothetical protein